jgi:predicted transcriptional regulator
VFPASDAKYLPGGTLEQAVLVALWDLGAASVREVHARVGEPNGLVYTTIAKVLDRLHAKGLVTRRRAGKVFIYRARARRGRVGRQQLADSIARLIGLDAAPTMAALVDAVESIDPKLLNELSRIVAERRKRKP